MKLTEAKYRLQHIPLKPKVGEYATRTAAVKCLLDRGINDEEKDDIKLAYIIGTKIELLMQKKADSYFLKYEPVSFVT